MLSQQREDGGSDNMPSPPMVALSPRLSVTDRLVHNSSSQLFSLNPAEAEGLGKLFLPLPQVMSFFFIV